MSGGASTSEASSSLQLHPEIKVRYTTKQLLQIFKSLGRFHSPCDDVEKYELEGEANIKILNQLCYQKPQVVL